MKPEIKKVETCYHIINKLNYGRALFVSSEFKDHIAISDYIGEAMSGAFKKWYKKQELIDDLRATADLIESFKE